MTDWKKLVNEHGPVLFRVASRILGHVADAEDVVQEVFLEAFRIRQRQSVDEWSGLLRRMTTLRALDRLRQRRPTVQLEDLSLVGNGGDPEASAIARELAERLRQAIPELPEREGAVFCLRYFEDLSYQQIANTLNMNAGAVATALHRARAKLEALLSEATKGE